jgi:hypothetical protein
MAHEPLILHKRVKEASLSAHNNKKPAEFSAGFFVFI